MGTEKDKYEQWTKEERQFAARCDREGRPELADRARERAIEYEKCRDSWLYRMFGW